MWKLTNLKHGTDRTEHPSWPPSPPRLPRLSPEFCCHLWSPQRCFLHRLAQDPEPTQKIGASNVYRPIADVYRDDVIPPYVCGIDMEVLERDSLSLTSKMAARAAGVTLGQMEAKTVLQTCLMWRLGRESRDNKMSTITSTHSGSSSMAAKISGFISSWTLCCVSVWTCAMAFSNLWLDKQKHVVDIR